MQLQLNKLGKVAITVEEDYYDPSKDYDKLTLVEVKDLYKVYISRIPVSAGTSITDRKYWMPFGNLKESIVINYNKFKEEISGQIDELYSLIDSAAAGGLYLEQGLGNKTNFGISQRGITVAINELSNRIAELTGVTQTELTITVESNYFDDDECELRISASIGSVALKFDSLRIAIDGNVIYDEVDVPELNNLTTTVTDTCIITCDAVILGKSYHAEKRVSKHSELWIGSGTTYQDAMIPDNQHSVTGGKVEGNYNVTTNNNDFIFIIMSNALAETFNKAEMDGFEIPFIRYNETPSGYVCFKSANTYKNGTYNIDLQ